MNCYVIFGVIPYESNDLLGVEFDYDKAELLFNKACDNTSYGRIFMAEVPVGELIKNIYELSDKPLLEKDVK